MERQFKGPSTVRMEREGFGGKTYRIVDKKTGRVISVGFTRNDALISVREHRAFDFVEKKS